MFQQIDAMLGGHGGINNIANQMGGMFFQSSGFQMDLNPNGSRGGCTEEFINSLP